MVTPVRYAVRPMAPSDIAQVVDIERESFSSMWPQTTYKRELQNRLAGYPVLGGRGALRRVFGRGSSSAPTPELIAGFVGIWRMVGEAHIVTLAVRDSQRR